jgi:hypothetical protein
LDFSEAAFTTLKQLSAEAKTPSNAATIRDALAVYKWFLETTKQGAEILVKNPNGEVERVKLLSLR